MVLFWIVWGGAVGAVVWYAVCNQITYGQRDKILNWAFEPRAPKWRQQVFDGVSYSEHLWCLFLLRDPRSLYEASARRLDKGACQ